MRRKKQTNPYAVSKTTASANPRDVLSVSRTLDSKDCRSEARNDIFSRRSTDVRGGVVADGTTTDLICEFTTRSINHASSDDDTGDE